MCDSIRKRSKACFIPFFDIDVELFMRTYIAGLIGEDVFRRWYFVPMVYAFYCVVAMLALLFIRETRDVKLGISIRRKRAWLLS